MEMNTKMILTTVVLLLGTSGFLTAQTTTDTPTTHKKWERTKIRQNTGLFHWELEWREGLTLSEHFSGKYGSSTYTRSDWDFDNGHALQTSLLFNIPTRASRETGIGQWTVGAGVGLHKVSGYNSLPVSLTARYRPFLRQVPSLFAYADLGMSILGKGHIYDNSDKGEYKDYNLGKSYDQNSFNYGPFGAVGIGYQHMFRQHFGLSVKLGMHLQQFSRQIGIHVVQDSEPTYWENTDGTRTETYGWHIDDLYYAKTLISSLQLGVGVVF